MVNQLVFMSIILDTEIGIFLGMFDGIDPLAIKLLEIFLETSIEFDYFRASHV